MLKINLITVGKVKDSFIQNGINEFVKRISKFANIHIIVVKEEKIDSPNALDIEEARILKLCNNGFNITMEINGEILSSKQFANKINQIQQIESTINFIIGSSHGLSQNVKDKSNYKMSFSKLTFPHQLFQLMLVEQIYRALSINNNGKYHK